MVLVLSRGKFASQVVFLGFELGDIRLECPKHSSSARKGIRLAAASNRKKQTANAELRRPIRPADLCWRVESHGRSLSRRPIGFVKSFLGFGSIIARRPIFG